jgi:hypothetical protein
MRMALLMLWAHATINPTTPLSVYDAGDGGTPMKTWMLAAAVFAAVACAQFAAAQAPPAYGDARTTASDEEVRQARRAYRAACQTRHNEAYCECMTGGMAQMLAPADLAIATAAFSDRAVDASTAARARAEAARTEVDRGCAQFR